MSVSYLFSLLRLCVCVCGCVSVVWIIRRTLLFLARVCVSVDCTFRYLRFPQCRHRINFSFRAQKPRRRRRRRTHSLDHMHTANRNEESRRARTLAFPLNDCECAQVNRISFASTGLFLYANAAALLFAVIVYWICIRRWAHCRRIWAIYLAAYVCLMCVRVLSFSLSRTSVAILYFSHISSV